jgi:hypothetical protein
LSRLLYTLSLALLMLPLVLLTSAQAAEKRYSLHWNHPDRKYNPDNPLESMFLSHDEIYASHIYVRYRSPDSGSGYTPWVWLTSVILESVGDSAHVDLMLDPAPYDGMCFAVQTELKNGQVSPEPTDSFTIIAEQPETCVRHTCHEEK